MPSRPVPRSRRWHLDSWPGGRLAYLYLAPALLFLAVTIAYPLVYALYISLHKVLFAGGVAQYQWIGLKYYRYFLDDPRLLKALSNTLVFTVVRVVLTMAIGLGIALALHNGVWGAEVFKRLFLIPWALSNVVNGLMWKWIYNGTYGIGNELLLRLGFIHKYVPWLVDQSTAMGAIIIADVWKSTPFVALLLLAGLQTVPKSLYEAARVDGAGALRCFSNVTLPSIRGVLTVVLIIQTMWALRVFDLIWVLTAGGPVDATNTLSLYAYEASFRDFNLGYGAAISYLVTGLTMVITLAYIKVVGRED